MKRNKKIVFSCNTAWFAHNHRLALMLACKDRGWQVHIICPDGPEVPDLKKHGLFVHTQEMSRKGVNPIHELQTLMQMFSKIRNIKPDVYHGFTIKPVIYGAICCRLNHIEKALFTITGIGSAFIGEGFKNRLVRKVLGFLYRRVFDKTRHTMVFQNPTDRTEFVANRWAPDLETHLIPGTGVDTSRFKPSREKYPKTTLIFAGRLMRDKGLDELLIASEQVYKKGEPFDLLILGAPDPENPSGYSLNEWQELCQKPYIKWLGSQRDVSSYVRKSHIACLPSYREGCPLFLLEAGACALPSIASDVPGCNYVISDDRNGLLVPVRNSEALTSAILTLLRDPFLRERLGKEARKRVLENLTHEKVIGMYLKIYDDTVTIKVAA